MCLYMWVFCLLEWLCGGGDSDHCAGQARASGDTGECLRKRGVRVLKYLPLLTPLAPGHSVRSLWWLVEGRKEACCGTRLGSLDVGEYQRKRGVRVLKYSPLLYLPASGTAGRVGGSHRGVKGVREGSPIS